MGRFWSPDAIGGNTGSPASLNRYAYAGEDPVNFFDPRGRYWQLPDTDCGSGWMTDASLEGPCQGDGGGGGCGSVSSGLLEGQQAPDSSCEVPEPPAPAPPAPRCSIVVANGGTPAHNQNPTGKSNYSPSDGKLGSYSVNSGGDYGHGGWYWQVQIQITLYGDTNPSDWNFFQTGFETLSGTLLGGQAFGPMTNGTGIGNDVPTDPSLIAQGTGYFDFLDNPGADRKPGKNLPDIVAGTFAFSFTTSAWTQGAYCSATWGFTITVSPQLPNGVFKWGQ